MNGYLPHTRKSGTYLPEPPPTRRNVLAVLAWWLGFCAWGAAITLCLFGMG